MHFRFKVRKWYVRNFFLTDPNMPKTVQDEADTVNNVGEQSEPKAQTFKSDKSDKHKAEPTGSVSANPKFDTRQKQLKNENNKVPISLPREYFADGLNYDSLVEFKENNDTIRGVIRWMGHTGDPQKIIAGVEVVRIQSSDIMVFKTQLYTILYEIIIYKTASCKLCRI